MSVALFAGPHNWMEFRYLLGRLPGRTGKLRNFFICSSVGILGLGLTSFLVTFTGSGLLARIWDTLLVIWVLSLCSLRARENPPRDWWWLTPLGLGLAGWIWISPWSFALALILGHPILALILCERELFAFRRPEQADYRYFLSFVPVGVLVIAVFCLTKDPSNAPLTSFLTSQNTSVLFVGAHTYLELLHYGVWILILPYLAHSTGRVRLDLFPALKKAPKRLILARWVLLTGVLVGLGLWAGFAYDYDTTRDLYFQLAIFHVLVEFPFLVRLC